MNIIMSTIPWRDNKCSVTTQKAGYVSFLLLVTTVQIKNSNKSNKPNSKSKKTSKIRL